MARSHLIVAKVMLVALFYGIAKGAPNNGKINNCPDAVQRYSRVINGFTAKILNNLFLPESTITVSGAGIAIMASIFEIYTIGCSKKELSSFLNITAYEVRCVAYTINSAVKESEINGKFIPVGSIYGNKELYKFTNQFKRDTRKIGLGEAEEIDFGKPNEAANKINQYNCIQTNGIIPYVISSKALNESTELVVTNAIVAQPELKYCFNRKQNTKDQFYITPCKSVTVDYQNQVQIYEYADSRCLQAQIARIPTKSPAYSIVIIIPYSNCGARKIIRQLEDPDVFSSLLKCLKRTPLTVSLPLFNASTLWDPQGTLTQLRLLTINYPRTADIVNAIKGNKPASVSLTRERVTLLSSSSEDCASIEPSLPRTILFKGNKPFIIFTLLQDAIVTGTVFGNPINQNTFLVDGDQ